jgi:hypothetical protein
MHKDPNVVLIHPLKPTLTIKVYLDYPQNLLIRFQNICPRNGGTNLLISVFRFKKIDINEGSKGIPLNHFSPYIGIFVVVDMVSPDTGKVILAMVVLTPLKFRENCLVRCTLYP